MVRSFFGLLALVFPLALQAQEAISFDKEVKPILRKHCGNCHNPDRARGELDISTYSAIMAGGTSGKVVVKGKPNESLLYTLTAHLEDPKMPPNSPKIPQRDLDLLKKWIEGGLLEKGTATSTAKETLPTRLEGLQLATSLPRATAIQTLALHSTGNLLAIPGKKQVLLLELPSGKILGGIPHESEIHDLKFSPDGKLLLVGGGIGGQSGQVTAFEVGTWKQKFQIGEESDVVLSCDLSSDGKHLVLGGPTRVVKLFSVPEGKMLHSFRKPTDWVTRVSFSPDGLLVAAGDRFGGLFLWETSSGKEFAILRGHTKAITGLSFSPKTDRLATTSEDGAIRLWDLHTFEQTASWTVHSVGSLDVQFHPSGKLITAGRDGKLNLWDATGKSIQSLGPVSDHLLQARLSDDGKLLVSSDWSGQVQLWSLESGKHVSLSLPVESKAQVGMVLPPKAKELSVPAVTPPAIKPTSNDNLVAERERARTELALAQESLRAAEANLAQSQKTVTLLQKLVEERAENLKRLETRLQGNSGVADKRTALKQTEEGLTRIQAALVADPTNEGLKLAQQEIEKTIRRLREELSSTDKQR
jgi:WD40 repeat protein